MTRSFKTTLKQTLRDAGKINRKDYKVPAFFGPCRRMDECITEKEGLAFFNFLGAIGAVLIFVILGLFGQPTVKVAMFCAGAGFGLLTCWFGYKSHRMMGMYLRCLQQGGSSSYRLELRLVNGMAEQAALSGLKTLSENMTTRIGMVGTLATTYLNKQAEQLMESQKSAATAPAAKQLRKEEVQKVRGAFMQLVEICLHNGLIREGGAAFLNRAQRKSVVSTTA